MGKKNFNQIAMDVGVFLLGSLLYAISVNVFTLPSNIAPGGLTGVSTLLNYLFGTPVGTMILLLNIPLFLLAVKFIGMRFLAKTVIATVMSSVVIDLTALFLPQYHGDGLLAAIYGGVFSGFGLSLIFLRGGTTGGTDILARLIQKILPYISMGQIILITDIVIIAAAALVYHSVNSGLYAVIAIFTSTTIIDKTLYGAEMGKVVYVFSKNSEEISKAIMNDLKRGVTILNARGGYSGDPREVLMCAVRRQEVFRLRKIVLKYDPEAFMVVGDVGQVLGQGFNRLEN